MKESGGEKVMKKKVYTIIMIAFMTLLLVSVGAIKCARAQAADRLDWPTVLEPTIDGTWTSEDEWTDGEETMIGENVVFRSTWSMLSMDPITVTTNFVVEILDDDTDDADDYWEICIDGTVDGGSAPQSGDFKIKVVGHTDLTVYEGDGTGWGEVTPEEDELVTAESISDSPTDSTPHWIIEFTILKTAGTVLMDPAWVFRLAVYDESNSEAGVRAWPEGSDVDVPDEWGVQNYSSDPIPEGLSFGVLVLLSSAAVIAATVVLRKRKN
jgi:hypothetical protein